MNDNLKLSENRRIKPFMEGRIGLPKRLVGMVESVSATAQKNGASQRFLFTREESARGA